MLAMCAGRAVGLFDMGDRKAGAVWRAAFLDALARGGSVTGASRVAGVDKGTAYDRRKRDAAFAAAWDRAKAGAQARLGVGETSPRLAPDEIVRASKHGRPCIARAGPGRWSAAKETIFLEMLAASASVRRACDAADVSTTAVYRRRMEWPGFAERWQAALTQGYARIETLLVETAAATLEVGTVTGALAGPAMTVGEVIGLLNAHRRSVAGDGPQPSWRRKEPGIEAVRADVLRRLAAIGG